MRNASVKTGMEGTTINGGTDLICSRITRSIAAAASTDPLALEPLYYAIDPEALARLLESDALDEVTFEYEEHTVRVDGDGVVSVDGTVYGR